MSASALRLRAQPDLGAATIALLQRGTLVEWVEQPQSIPVSWGLVRAGNKTGFVSRKYLTPHDHPSAPRPEEFPWMTIALYELGQREVAGIGSNRRITEYQLSTQLDGDERPSDETPWCSDFACWCVEMAGYASTNSASARSWLSWGRQISSPRRGCIVVLSRPSGGAKGGHVGFFIERKHGVLTLLGGNQGNAVSFAEYPAARLLGYRIP